MRRFPAFDPPEYLEWSLDPRELERYEATLREDPDRWAVVDALTRAELLSLYRDLLLTRLQDTGLKRWVRQGVISKAWLGTGEEAVTVGAVGALERDLDVVCPMIRNAGACHMMGMPLADAFRGYLATADGPNGGHDLHIGNLRRGVLQPISHMGTNASVMTGVALALKQRALAGVALTWVGDGATRTAAAHEGLSLAAVLRVPAIFVIQNNQVALGTRLDQHGVGDIHRWPEIYGLEPVRCDGNNVLDVLAATRVARARCVAGGGPVVIVADTFRMGGHATHDEREARETFPPSLFTAWGRRDPVGLFESWLGTRDIPPELLTRVESEAIEVVDESAEEALLSRDRTPEPVQALYDSFSEGGTLIGLGKRPF